MSVELVGEDAQRARYERNRSVGMPAGSAACDLREPASQKPGVWRVPAALHELLEARCDRRETVDAGTALSCTLFCQITSDARRLHDAARIGGKDDDRARSE